MRLLDDARLPAYKGAMLRGGFGIAFKRGSCPQTCWSHPKGCAIGAICPYRWVFETPHPPDVSHLHDLQDVPRPFVIEPPHDDRTQYGAGDALEFGLLLIGRGIDHLPYFLFGFEQLGRLGLGGARVPARLERVEALQPWRAIGQPIYQDGRVLPAKDEGRRTEDEGQKTKDGLPIYDTALVAARAAALPADLRLTLRTPLRVKSRGAFIETIDLLALVQALCWRLNALATFHGSGPWPVDHRALAEQARSVTVEEAHTRWVDWERISSRAPQQRMKLGGIVGSALLRGVPPDVRMLLLMGSLVHVGKACVFGHGEYRLDGVGLTR
jgi:hypothetical protein